MPALQAMDVSKRFGAVTALDRGTVPLRRNRPLTSGIAVSDRNSEHSRVKMIVRPTSPIQVVISVRPPITSGRNTMIDVAVELITAGSTSFEPRSHEDAQIEFAKRLADPPMDEPGQLISRALTSGPGQRIMGEVMLFQRDLPARQGEIGYMLHPEFQGRGFALEAARVMLGQGFDVLGWHRIYARLSDANTPSVRLLEKLGMHAAPATAAT